MSVHSEHETPDSLAKKIQEARAVDQAATLLQAARDAERVDRDVAVAREFGSTARLAQALAEK